MKKIAIVQSNYIPWKGYFDLIAAVDEFILYDDVQYTRRDWRNRNQIKTPRGVEWMTVPVKVKGRFEQIVRKTEVDGVKWAKDHWKSLVQNYRSAPCFGGIASWLEPLYLNEEYTHLSQLNHRFMSAISSFLGITTPIRHSRDYPLSEGRSKRLAELCVSVGATEYISGPAAREYIDETVFAARGITLKWFDYAGYPEYPQLWGKFVHGVSILDLLFNCGKDAPRYMRYVRS
ncbi:MAG: WbqC family protein [Elusimicrobia bacterium]|nr:WbqC family protein [Elusimicrobiota bacterium]